MYIFDLWSHFVQSAAALFTKAAVAQFYQFCKRLARLTRLQLSTGQEKPRMDTPWVLDELTFK